MPLFALAYFLSYVASMYGTFFIDVKWGIYMYILQYWFFPTSRWWVNYLPNLRWSFTIAVCIMGGFFIKMGKYTQTRLFDVPHTKWFIMNLMMILLISNWAVWPVMHNKFRGDHFKLLTFIAIAYKAIDTPAKLEGMMWAHMVGAYYVGYETKRQGRDFFGRVEGTGPSDSGGDGNNCAASMASTVPIFMFFLVRSHVMKRKWWEKLILFFLFAYVMNGIILINSRGSFIALVTSSVYLGGHAFLNRRVTMSQRVQMVLLVFAAIGAFLILADDSFWERMGSISESAESDTGGGGRKVFWGIAWNLAKIYPLGVGGWGFAYLSPQYVPAELMPQNSSIRAVHSLYFQTLVERGYFGFFIWFFLIVISDFSFCRKTRKYLQRKGDMEGYFLGLVLESSLVAFLTCATFLNRLNCEILYHFPMMIAMYGNIYMLKDQRKEALERAREKKERRKKLE